MCATNMCAGTSVERSSIQVFHTWCLWMAAWWFKGCEKPDQVFQFRTISSSCRWLVRWLPVSCSNCDRRRWGCRDEHKRTNVRRRESLAGLVERANTSRSRSSKDRFLWLGCAAASAKVNEALPPCWTNVGWSRLPETTTGAVHVRAAKMDSSSALPTLASTSPALATRSLGPRISRDDSTGAWCPLPVQTTMHPFLPITRSW